MTRWLLLLWIVPTFAFANSENQALNRIYQEFSDAYSQLDVDALQSHYQANAQMLRVSDKQPVVNKRSEILKAYNHWFSKVEERNASIEIRFRCANRVLQDDTAIDSGYYVMRYYPSKESGESPSQFGGKYMFTFTKNKQGKWAILGDASNRVKNELYLESKQVEGLVYDAPFPDITSTKNP